MKKQYKLEIGKDVSITLEIDTDKITEEMAREINALEPEGDRILEISGGDAHQAVARRAAGPLLAYMLAGYHASAAVGEYADEGRLYAAHGGITIIDHESPMLSSSEFKVTEIAT